jgi:hypothetical protein
MARGWLEGVDSPNPCLIVSVKCDIFESSLPVEEFSPQTQTDQLSLIDCMFRYLS